MHARITNGTINDSPESNARLGRTGPPRTPRKDQVPRPVLPARQSDRALGGGIASASITCISGERDDAAVKSTVRIPAPRPRPGRLLTKTRRPEQLALHLAASHLLSSPAARAAVVHAGGPAAGFDVARLH